MPAVNGPFGLRPTQDIHTGGDISRVAYPAGIASGFGTSIAENTPVSISAAGQIVPVSGTTDGLIGVFLGVSYLTNGSWVQDSFWTAGQVGSSITAFVTQSPALTYEIQLNGTIAQTVIGEQINFVPADITAGTPALNATTRISTARGSNATLGTVQGQLRIIGIGSAIDNALGDAFPIVRVQIARHQFTADKVGV